jgi:hypothetical protein
MNQWYVFLYISYTLPIISNLLENCQVCSQIIIHAVVQKTVI